MTKQSKHTINTGRGRANYSVLLVDDEQHVHRDFRENPAFSQFEKEGALNAQDMWQKLKENPAFDLIILDLKLDGNNPEIGLDLIQDLKEVFPNIPVVVFTADKEVQTVVEAMRRGAENFVPKYHEDDEFKRQQFEKAITNGRAKKSYERARRVVAEAEKQHKFVGETPAILSVKRLLEKLAMKPSTTVLLNGETGTGKEVAARYLHRHGPRADKPFVAVNLSVIPPDLMAATLFGSLKGAYTDAKNDIRGYFQEADGGVLFLDEIGDINHDIQVKLLRFLEDRSIRPLGAAKDIRLDVQIIVATHKDLESAVKLGTFREDLYYRFPMKVLVPALRDRAGDIPLIVEHHLSQQYGNIPPDFLLEDAVLDFLNRYYWPGNVRQLRNTLEGLFMWRDTLEKEKVDEECLGYALPHWREAPTSAFVQKDVLETFVPASTVPSFASFKEKRSYEELQQIEQALQSTKNNKTDAVERLGMRGTDHLSSKIKVVFKNFPHLFQYFSNIREAYPNIIKVS